VRFGEAFGDDPLDSILFRFAAAESHDSGAQLLKGLSHKEIAEVRSITEATARQQAFGSPCPPSR
jgi:hypothetical protein